MSAVISLVAVGAACVTFATCAPEKRTDSWEVGKASWLDARDSDLWDKPNACDPTVLTQSAPLTVLYGLSSIWEKVKQRRETEGLKDKPLEVHVIGAAYPFEGRSDWSVLAERRPASVPRVRVSLVLGTPFQSDNVPPLANQPNSLLSTDAKVEPVTGKWSTTQEELICKGGGKWGTDDLDKEWSKESLCRDHGNGLEVVCIEQFYQDVSADLPKPDLAMMFSPGFPQMGRRSWDATLIGLLNDEVPMMISDVTIMPSWGHKLHVEAFGSKPVLPGGRWNPSAGLGEDWQTWMLMTKYGAKRLKARRGPFPILHKEDGRILAKNAVVHIYQGYKTGRKPTLALSAKDIQKYEKTFNEVQWNQIEDEECEWTRDLMKKHLKFPTSRAFDNALRRMYAQGFQDRAKAHEDSYTAEQRSMLEAYGVLKGESTPRKSRRWDLKAWVYILENVGCEGIDSY